MMDYIKQNYNYTFIKRFLRSNTIKTDYFNKFISFNKFIHLSITVQKLNMELF